jgi:hypothetical protein
MNSAKNALNLFSPPQTPSLRGLSPVSRRADLSRTFVLVVALLLAAVSTSAFARARCIPDPQGEKPLIDQFHSRHLGAGKEPHDHFRIGVTDLNRTIVALIGATTRVLIVRLRRVELT